MNTELATFLAAFKFNVHFRTILADAAGLNGTADFAPQGCIAPGAQAQQYEWKEPAPRGLTTLSLKDNHISGIMGPPPSTLAVLILSNNPLTTLDNRFLKGSKLALEMHNITNPLDKIFPMDRNRRNGQGSYICFEPACAGLTIDPNIFDPRRLCECSEGYMLLDHGNPVTDCEPVCQSGAMPSDTDGLCLSCGDSQALADQRCPTSISLDGKCGANFTGPLCTACADGYHVSVDLGCAACPTVDWVAPVRNIVVGIGIIAVCAFIWRRCKKKRVTAAAQQEQQQDKFEIEPLRKEELKQQLMLVFQYAQMASIIIRMETASGALHASAGDEANHERPAWVRRVTDFFLINVKPLLESIHPECFAGFEIGRIWVAMSGVFALPVLLALLLVGTAAIGKFHNGIRHSFLAVSILYISGVGSADFMTQCQSVGFDGLPLKSKAFVKAVPTLQCEAAGAAILFWTGYAALAIYIVLIPLGIVLVFRETGKHIACPGKGILVPTLQNGSIVLRSCESFQNPNDEPSKSLWSAAAAYGVALADSTHARSVRFKQLGNEIEVTAHDEDELHSGEITLAAVHAMTPTARTLHERTVLDEAKGNSAFLQGVEGTYQKYAAQSVLAEAFLKIPGAMVSNSLGSASATAQICTTTLTTAALLHVSRPFSSNQRNRLAAICYACLALLAFGVRYDVQLQVLMVFAALPWAAFVHNQCRQADEVLRALDTASRLNAARTVGDACEGYLIDMTSLPWKRKSSPSKDIEMALTQARPSELPEESAESRASSSSASPPAA